MSDIRTAKVRITGRVQGVSFRVWTQREANALGLSGWVRNERDGSVSAVVSGPRDAVEAMLSRLHAGPDAATVEHVAVAEAGAAPEWRDFRILR